MVKFERKDIVRLNEPKFEELRGVLWFKDNAFEITKVEDSGMVSLFELDTLIHVEELRPMPIGRKYAGNIYYDPIIAASVVGVDDEIPVHRTDYSYFMDAFVRVTEEDETTLLTLVEEQKFKYVHEVQHWLRERYGSDDLKIHHKLVTLTEIQYQNLWGLREDLLEAGVSSYQFLYEMSNMLYLRWMAFYKDEERARWKELERATGDELLQKYQQAIKRAKQETRIYSPSVLEQAIKEISKCAKKENIAELFDLMLEENIKMKDGGATHNTTPKVLAQLLVEVMQPKVGEYWYDPAAGFSGFLIEINKYLRENNDNYHNLTEKDRKFQITEALSGMEIQKEAARIGFCNTRFHGLWCDVKNGDSLKTVDYQQYDGVVCEPPLPVYTLAGRSKLGNANRNRQTEFVELIVNSLSLQPGSRAALLLPENFLFKSTMDYRIARKRLFEDCHLHTILRLPQGIYPNTTISMCALFIERQGTNDDKVLVYDMQTGNQKPEQHNNFSIFKDFIRVYRNRTADKRSSIVTVDTIRNDDYRITFDKHNQQVETQLETPNEYLAEANKVVRDIRSLLSRIEKEING